MNRYVQAWRDIDDTKRRVGLVLWATGGEIRLGRRLYRWRYEHRSA
jgi:hypothetical protein